MEAPLTRIHLKGITTFKVQVNFDIPFFKGNLEVDALEKWLSLLKGYYFVKKHSNGEKMSLNHLV